MRGLLSKQIKGECVERVACEYRSCLIKGFVDSRLAASDVIIIHTRQIIMNQRIDMDALNRGRHAQRRTSIHIE
jgi:hypothetical protein